MQNGEESLTLEPTLNSPVKQTSIGFLYTRGSDVPKPEREQNLERILLFVLADAVIRVDHAVERLGLVDRARIESSKFLPF